jgi:predicted transcriptional regulator
MKVPRLTRYELELMNVVWKKREATVQEVCDELKRPLAYTTVMTTLSLLNSKKKALKRVKRGRAHVYLPAVTREDVSRAVLGELQETLFDGQLTPLVLGLLEGGRFSREEVKALRESLRRADEKAEKL